MRCLLRLFKGKWSLLRLFGQYNSVASISTRGWKVLDLTLGDSLENFTNLESKLTEGGKKIGYEMSLLDSFRLLHGGLKFSSSSALANLIRFLTDLCFRAYCLQLHGSVIKLGFASSVAVSNALIKFYKKLDVLESAYNVFVEIPEPSVISWNSLISGCIRNGKVSQGLDLFLKLERSDIRANAFSLSAALTACGQLGNLELGMSIHAKILKLGLEDVNVVANCMIDMYGKCCSVEQAIRVFHYLDAKDIISWNSVIASCARNGHLESARYFFDLMPVPDTISYNEVINGISHFGDITDAINILSSMQNPNSSSWNSILTGLVNRHRTQEALNFLSIMHSNGVEMDEFTHSVMMSGITRIADLKWGKSIHSYIMKCSLDSFVVVGSALIDMYSKCGQVEDAECVFHTLPRQNLITWNAMISGYAHNSDPMKAIQLFEQLKLERDMKPDGLTFLNILAGCSHCDIELRTAVHYFESMTNEYGIKPSVQHCCSMIRLMGQKGEMRRAQQIIHGLGFASYSVVWRSLLGACEICSDLEVAKIAAARMIGLGEENDDYVYIMLSNLYARHGKWKEANFVRKLMRGNGVRKETGCSWIRV